MSKEVAFKDNNHHALSIEAVSDFPVIHSESSPDKKLSHTAMAGSTAGTALLSASFIISGQGTGIVGMGLATVLTALPALASFAMIATEPEMEEVCVRYGIVPSTITKTGGSGYLKSLFSKGKLKQSSYLARTKDGKIIRIEYSVKGMYPKWRFELIDEAGGRNSNLTITGGAAPKQAGESWERALESAKSLSA